MPELKYSTAAGFVQFPVEERDVSGQTVRDVTIRTQGENGILVRITVWPEWEIDSIEEGDFVSADGKFEAREVGDKTYHNLNSITRLFVGKGVKRAEREVVNKRKF